MVRAARACKHGASGVRNSAMTDTTPTEAPTPGPNRDGRGGKRVTVREAADHCGVGATTIRRWIDQGRIVAYRTGPRIIRVDLESVEAQVVRVVPTDLR